MERDVSIEKITAELVESLLTSVCNMDCFLTNFDTGVQPQKKQQSTMITSQNFDSSPSSRAVIAEQNIEAKRKTKIRKINHDVTQRPLQFRKKQFYENQMETQPTNSEEFLEKENLKISKFPCNSNPFDECNEMIEKLLDSLETELNKKDRVKSLSIEQLHDTVSDLHEPDQKQGCMKQTDTSNCYSGAAGITVHCPARKVGNDQSLACKSRLNSPCPSSNKNESVFDNFDVEIDQMVNEIISNNVELLACCQTKNTRSIANLDVQFSLSKNSSSSTASPVSSECSDTLAELKLSSNASRSQTDLRISDKSENAVPSGWLNTINKRKHRTNQISSRERCRNDDFAYCGPKRENNNNVGPIIPCFTCLKLRTPVEATEIPAELLHSGAAIKPGVCDKNGLTLVIILADDILWQKSGIGAISLARLLLYLTNRLNQISLILDCRNSTVEILKILLETFSILRNNSRVEVQQIYHLFTDHDSNLASFRSALKSLFDSEFVFINSVDDLSTYIDSPNLLHCYGGQLEFSQAEWAQNRLVVDSFVAFCENVRRNFSRETISMTSQPLPPTAAETKALLEQHQLEMTQLLDDRQITNLRNRSARILDQLQNDVSVDANCSAFRSCSQLVQSSFTAANEAITQFVRVADDRLISLEQHLLIKQFEQSCEYINHWYASNLKTLTEVFTEIPESFDELRKQRSEFDAFYINAMTDYAKCDCLLSEVEQLNELGYLRETELTQRAKITEEQVTKLVSMMEQKKEEVEVATHMYKFIDQAYSWALEGMKFVAMLNMNECSNYDSCHKMMEEFDEYMTNHPPIPDGSFVEIQDLCRRYGNMKCLEKCDYAMQKCRETLELFQKRRELISKLQSQFKSSKKKRIPFRLKGRVKSESNEQDRIRSAASYVFSTNEDQLKESTDKESVGNLSQDSFDSSGFEEWTEHTVPTSPSPCIPRNEVNFASKANPKPARKILKKSVSLPSHEMAGRITHHHVYSKSGVPLTIGSPVQTEELEHNGKTKVTLMIEELIATEKEYVKSLNYVIEHYFPEMCKLDLPQALRCRRNVIFGNIEKIAEFHSNYFLQDLENCNGNPLLVAKAFQSHKISFGLYALYSKNKPQSDELLREHGNEFFKTKQLELGDKLDLASYLLKPVQRMGKYALLLHGMAKHCKSEEEKGLRDAEELVKFQLRHGNDLLTMDSIRECDVNLREQGNLLRQDQFIVFSGRRKVIRRVFLFEEMILFSKPILVHGGHDVYQYKGSYKTAEIGMTENIGDSGLKFEIWFRRRRPQSAQDTFTFQSTTRAMRRAWVDEIRNLLWKQALHNRDYRKKEMSSMGVGSKPHLDLTYLSKNSITDRSVVATPPGDRSFFSSRLPRGRTRVSIAVPSFEYVAQQSKRPHSTISTSSSTSSVGSGNNQSASLVSSLALASWQTHSDAKLLAGCSPPMAYCDFHAIAEDLNEDCESSSDSSVLTPPEETTDLPSTSLLSPPTSPLSPPKSPISRQYVSTV